LNNSNNRFKNVLNLSKIRLEFEHSKLEYYTEIDAVEIIGYSHDISNSRKIANNLRSIADSFGDMSMGETQVKSILESDSKTEPVVTDSPNEPSSPKTMFKQQKSISWSKESRRRSSNPTTPPNKMTSCSNITELPNEILNLILSYLDLKAIFSLRSTCKAFYDVCSDDHLFKKLDLQPYWNLVIICKF
jgi:F-box/leucine-rich repeat protein 4